MKGAKSKETCKALNWKKILYEEQGVADNFVPDCFLQELTKNSSVRLYSYWELVFSSVILNQQLCIVFIFILCWWSMSVAPAKSAFIFGFSLIFCFLGYITYLKINQVFLEQQKIASDIKTAILLLSFTAFFSPVLKTLTHTISTDTIYAMTTLMLLGHFLFLDYDTNAIFASRSISLNMSVFASVCLASRLEATSDTFVTVVLAFQLFGLWPLLRRSLWKHNPHLLWYLTAFMAVVVIVGLALINIFSSLVFMVVILSIAFVLPAILLCLQKHKDNIHGPWDEAVISQE